MCVALSFLVFGLVLEVVGVPWILWDTAKRRVPAAPPASPVHGAPPERFNFFSHVVQEYTRYRDYEWNMTVWAVTLLAAVVAVTRAGGTAPESRAIGALAVGVVVVVALFLAHVIFAHVRVHHQRGLYDALRHELFGVPIDTVPRWTRGLGHLASWCGLIFMSAGVALYALLTWGK